MRVGSFCTGIGGLDLAVEAHYGAELAWYSEVEPAPCTVLEREWPGVPNLGDLTTFDWSEVPPVDIITAGYPCQPFSHAGKRKGASDARHLWPYIADAVRHLRPRHVVLENVAGHLSLGFDTVLGDLAEAGFDAEWCVLRASEVGCCHARARLFITATNTDSGPAGRLDRGVPRTAAGARREDLGIRAAVDGGAASPDPYRERLAGKPERHGQPVGPRFGSAQWDDADRCGLATSVALLPSPRTSDTNGPGTHGDGGLDLRTAVALLPTPLTDPAANNGHARTLAAEAKLCDDEWIATLPDGRRIDYGPAVRRWEVLFGEPAPSPRDKRGKLNPDLPRWMMGYPADWLSGLGRTQRLKAAGNAVVPQQAAAALRELSAA